MQYRIFTKIILIAILLSGTKSFAQITMNTPWVWMNGDSSVNNATRYGTKGIPDIQNTPGSRCDMVYWTDKNDNFWLFGGSGFTTKVLSPYHGELNDLWKYDHRSNRWTWVWGDSMPDQGGMYNRQGVSSPNNKPGSRCHSAHWVDKAGNLWMFGGAGYLKPRVSAGAVNDLWKYDIAANEWTWMKGDSIGHVASVFGTQGVANATNKPGARQQGAYWTDTAGNFWLFGGYYYGFIGSPNSVNQPFLVNDLWKYDPKTNEWTWIKGDTTANPLGVYGTKGVSNAANKPGGRNTVCTWVDANNNFWLFGGQGYGAYPSSGGQSLNDLWKYNPVTNEWTWVSGSNLNTQFAVYGTQGIAAATNIPSARQNAVSWTDNMGNLWMYGGGGSGGIGELNDLWKYDIAANEWTWVKGLNGGGQTGIYGKKGVPAAGNRIGARGNLYTANWGDANGNLWVFGGFGYVTGGYGYMNDLWKLGGCVITKQLNPMVGIDSICPGTVHTYEVPNSVGPITWHIPAGWTGASTTNKITVTAGTNGGTISASIKECDDSSVASMNVYVWPMIPVLITVNGYILGTAGSYATYQWFMEGQAIPGATAPYYMVTVNGNYKVVVTNSGGCVDSSSYLVTNVGVSTVQSMSQDIKVYPNPANDILHIAALAPVNIILVSMDGKCVLQQNKVTDINIKDLAEGVYMLQIVNADGTLLKVERVVKIKQ